MGDEDHVKLEAHLAGGKGVVSSGDSGLNPEKTEYTPPEKETGNPAVARCGPLFHVCFPVFASYNRHAYPAHKYLVKHCIEQLLADPVVKCEQVPSTGRVTVTEKGDMRMVHVKLTCPEQRGNYQVIEDRPVLHNAVIRLKTAGEVGAVYVAPDRTPLSYEREGDYIRVELPPVDGYMMVVAER